MGSPIVNLKLDECPNCQSNNFSVQESEIIDEFRVEDLICLDCSCEWDQDINIHTDKFNGAGSYIRWPE